MRILRRFLRLSILFMRFFERISLTELVMSCAFNSLYEILATLSTLLLSSNPNAFNSLYEIRRSGKLIRRWSIEHILSILFMRFLVHMDGLASTHFLSILFMRFKRTGGKVPLPASPALSILFMRFTLNFHPTRKGYFFLSILFMRFHFILLHSPDFNLITFNSLYEIPFQLLLLRY